MYRRSIEELSRNDSQRGQWQNHRSQSPHSVRRFDSLCGLRVRFAGVLATTYRRTYDEEAVRDLRASTQGRATEALQ
jgi:hypothetical protein